MNNLQQMTALGDEEILRMIEAAIDTAVTRVELDFLSEQAIKNFESITLQRLRYAIGKRKLEKIASLITERNDWRRDAVRELARAYDALEMVQLPHATKSRVLKLQIEIDQLIEFAHFLAIRFGWSLVGGFNPDSAEYEFEIKPLRYQFSEDERRVG